VAARQPIFDYLSKLDVAEQGLEQQLSATRATGGGKSTLQDWLRRAENLSLNKLVHGARHSAHTRLQRGCPRLLLGPELEGQSRNPPQSRPTLRAEGLWGGQCNLAGNLGPVRRGCLQGGC